jgi:hypothetical protein
MSGLVVVGHAKPSSPAASGSGGGGDVLAVVAHKHEMAKAVSAQRIKRPQSARQARTPQPPPVCNVLDGLQVSSVRRRPHSAGPGRHRQHGNADDVWVVETPDQMRARPPSAPADVRAKTRTGRTHYRGVTRLVRPRTVELTTGAHRDGSIRSKGNALQTTAVAMAVRRRCAGVLAPAECSQPVAWRDYKPSAKEVAREVETARAAADAASARRAAATRAAKQPKPGPAGFGSRSARLNQNHTRQQSVSALLGQRVPVHTVQTELTSRACLIGDATPRRIQQDAFKRADRQRQEHERTARMAVEVAQKNPRKESSPLILRATYEAALRYGRDWATLGAAAREVEILLEVEKIMKVSLAPGRVRRQEIHAVDTVIPGVQPSVQLTPEEQAEEHRLEQANREHQERIRANMTAWVGGIPRALAEDQAALLRLLSQFGEVDRLSIRLKEGDYKCWCLARFKWHDPVGKMMAEPIEVPFEPTDSGEPSDNQEKAIGRQQPTLKVKRADVQGQLANNLERGQAGALAYTKAQLEDQQQSARAAPEQESIEMDDVRAAESSGSVFRGTSMQSKMRSAVSKDGANTHQQLRPSGANSAVLELTGRAQQPRESIESVLQGPTAWVGGIPGALACNRSEATELFSRFGELQPGGLKIRQKDGNYASWCLVSFVPWDPVGKLMATAIQVPYEAADLLGNETAQTGPRPVLKVKRADVEGELKHKSVDSNGKTGQALTHIAGGNTERSSSKLPLSNYHKATLELQLDGTALGDGGDATLEVLQAAAER